MKNITNQLSVIAGQIAPDSIALSSSTEQLTYHQLIEKVTRYGHWLKEKQAQLIGLHMQNKINWVALDLACQQEGVACVPLPTFFTHDQIKWCLELAGVDLLISDCLDIKSLKIGSDVELDPLPMPDVSSSDEWCTWKLSPKNVALIPSTTQKITFTSGSTGDPKGVCLSQEQQWNVARTLANDINIMQPKHLCLLPLSTLLENIAGVYSPLLKGGTVIIPSDRERGFEGSSGINVSALLKCIFDSRPTTLILIPQLLSVLVAACKQGWKPPASIKFIAVGGGKVAAELIQSARAFDLPVFQGYGLSECGSVVSLNSPDSQRGDSVGAVLPHCSIEIVNDEIVVKGATFLGYLGDPESWYPDRVFTGDIGYLDQGYLYIRGRKKNTLITRFGRNINPEWVESELLAQPLLSQCIVLGDDRPSLCSLLSAPVNVPDFAIDAWVGQVNKKLPDYAQIRHWTRLEEAEFVPFLTANGRVQRVRFSQAYSELVDGFYSEKLTLINQ